MDTFFTGDIPQDFHFAQFNSNYVDLYNTNNIRSNSTYTYYRVYNYGNGFYYDTRELTTGNYVSNYSLVDIPVSDKMVYRKDFGDICVTVALMVGFGVWLLNLMTSVVRKGGVLGGLF